MDRARAGGRGGIQRGPQRRRPPSRAHQAHGLRQKAAGNALRRRAGQLAGQHRVVVALPRAVAAAREQEGLENVRQHTGPALRLLHPAERHALIRLHRHGQVLRLRRLRRLCILAS